MTITKKPRASSTVPKPAMPEADIQALIAKGGSVAQAEERKPLNDNKPQLVQLRLDRHVIDRIDAVLETRLVKTPRHTWLLEAVHEKLTREEENVRKTSE
ncbi:MAG TPA: hypothetical protein VES89_11005 [Candidatus Competibacteraceae bacterium]|nr:hypothetical protein [Candidatus Competibacteraceae bacterium]